MDILRNSQFFDRSFSQEKKCYNLGSFAMLTVCLVLTVASVLTRTDSVIMSVSLVCVIFIYSLYYVGHISENYSVITTVTAIVYNLLYIPFIMLKNGKIVSGIGVFSTFAFLYIVITMTGIRLYIMMFLTLIAYISMVVYMYTAVGISEELATPVAGVTFLGIVTSTVFIGNLSGICVRALIKIFEEEQDKAKAAMHNSELLSGSKDTFFSNMSHEIRTPMNAILGTSQLLLETDIDEDDRDKVLNILNATNALLSSINDMLDITHIETGEISIEESEYDFGEMISDIVNMISVRVMDRNLEFVVKVDADIPKNLYGDGKRLRQVFINILNNSVKYTKEGTITLNISKEVFEEDKVLIVASIKDTGIGIKEADKAKLFSEFERLDTSSSGLDNVEGTGLGLSICKEILKAMDGEITFDSTYHVGTEFLFRVPQKVVDNTENVAAVSEEYSKYRILVFEKSEECDDAIIVALSNLGIEADSAFGTEMFRQMFLSGVYTHIMIDRLNYDNLSSFLEPRMGECKLILLTDINQTDAMGIPGAVMIRPVFSPRISDYLHGKRHSLVRRINIRGNFIAPDATVMTVDDNITNLQVVEKILAKYKMRVITASGGKEALLKLANEKVDMIFLDYMMPEMDGVDTLKNIRAMSSEWTKTVPIVALTANAVGGVKEMLLSEGFDDYISKPIELSKLERMLIKYLPENYIKQSDFKEK